MSRESHIHHSPDGTIVCTDDTIRDEILARLTQAGHLDAAGVSVSVDQCKVTLTGSVSDPLARHLIEDLVESCPGVQDVDNHLHVHGA